MYEGLHSALGGIAVCVSKTEYFAGTTTMVIANCQAQEHGNLPQDDPHMPACSNSTGQCTDVNCVVWRAF
jgi:hypothetical protein